MISFNQKQMRNVSVSCSKEWMLADGDGGYAGSTLCFMNTRRQHSLLTVSTNLPLRRFTLLNKLDEEVIIEGQSYMLASNSYPGTIFPPGYKYISRFTFDHFPQVAYDLGGCQITKKVLMPRRSGTLYCHYENNSKKAMTLRLLPLISFRLKDSIRKAGEGFLVDELPDGVRIISDMNLPKLYLKLSQIYTTSPESYWYYDFIYEHDTGLYDTDREDLFNIGYWETDLEPGKGLTFAASTRDLAEFDYAEIEAHYIESVEAARSASGLPKRFIHLADTAANHVVSSRSIRSQTILSGYPYGGLFTIDTLTAMDGISNVIAKGNYEQEYLYDLVANEMAGAFPSSVDESTLHVNYDNQEIPLYFALALKRCAIKEGNADCLRRYLPMLENGADIIIQNNLGGLRMKESRLVDLSHGGPEGPAGTLKNAVVNALWYNYLKITDEAKAAAGASGTFGEIEAEIESAYYGTFFDEDGAYIAAKRNPTLESDMALPLVLPYSPLTQEQREKIFASLVRRLLSSFTEPALHDAPGHACNLTAVYLTEAGETMGKFKDENVRLREVVTQLFTMEEYTRCVNGLPKCSIESKGRNPKDPCSSVVAGEAIRVIRKLKLK